MCMCMYASVFVGREQGMSIFQNCGKVAFEAFACRKPLNFIILKTASKFPEHYFQALLSCTGQFSIFMDFYTH